MFICICNAIRESELRDAALRHGGDAEAIYAELGKKPDCRQCLEEAEELLDEARSSLMLEAAAA